LRRDCDLNLDLLPGAINRQAHGLPGLQHPADDVIVGDGLPVDSA
jgi:hypothetical protein